MNGDMLVHCIRWRTCDAAAEQKWRRVLRYLVSGQRLTRFSAEAVCHDHCLPSTIADLEKKGLVVGRSLVTVNGYHGEPAHVAEYWLSPKSRERARALLDAPTHQPSPSERVTANVGSQRPIDADEQARLYRQASGR